MTTEVRTFVRCAACRNEVHRQCTDADCPCEEGRHPRRPVLDPALPGPASTAGTASRSSDAANMHPPAVLEAMGLTPAPPPAPPPLEDELAERLRLVNGALEAAAERLRLVNGALEAAAERLATVTAALEAARELLARRPA